MDIGNIVVTDRDIVIVYGPILTVHCKLCGLDKEVRPFTILCVNEEEQIGIEQRNWLHSISFRRFARGQALSDIGICPDCIQVIKAMNVTMVKADEADKSMAGLRRL